MKEEGEARCQYREIGESDWRDCSEEDYERYSGYPEMDTRRVGAFLFPAAQSIAKGKPPSLSALKTEAKALKKATGAKHSACLEYTARLWGFASFNEAVMFYRRNEIP